MRIRASHIIVAVLAVITLFLLYVAGMNSSDTPPDQGTEGLSPPVDTPIANAPEISLETESLDFGTIPRDQDSEKVVRIFNKGGSILEIREIQTSCNLCTRAKVSPDQKQVPPGGFAELHVTVIPRGIKGFYSKKTVSVSSNDPRNTKVQLTVEARVDPEFVLEPENFDFGTVEKGEPAAASVLFRPLIDTPIQVTGVLLTLGEEKKEYCPGLTLAFEPVPESEWKSAGRKEYRITATLSPLQGTGNFETPVFLETDLERFKHHQVYARGQVTAPYELVFDAPGNVIRLKSQEQESTLVVKSDAPLQLSLPEQEDAILSVTLEQESPEQWKVRGKVVQGLAPGANEGRLLLDVQKADKVYHECIRVFAVVLGPSR